MYVCNCNGITEKQVKAALCQGVRHWEDVHAHYGCVPQCGKCQCEIAQYMADHGTDESADAASLFGLPVMAT